MWCVLAYLTIRYLTSGFRADWDWDWNDDFEWPDYMGAHLYD